MKKIVLASASPRRKELLNKLRLDFEVMISPIDENVNNEKFSLELIKNLAFEKAKSVAEKLESPAIVIGSDTMVVVDDKILGKPKDNNDAFDMLQLLSGKVHKVVSAIAIIDTENHKTLTDAVISEVSFRKLTTKEISNYISSGESADKAGAYAIQGIASIFVESIKGCYDNIVGLSTYKLAEMLAEFDIKIL